MGNEADDEQEHERVSPTAFMRQLRPEYYSDTQDRTDYRLDEAQLGYQLATITERNETHSFEIFCRKLCERTICPNLKPQTGPEGGGDSKADAETYPVAKETSRFWFVGEAEAGTERWAFAFSAKKEWSEKARNDVQGLIDTSRGYSKIIVVTSRPARAKDRARIEDELTNKHGVQITILDRSWIIKEIVEGDRKDLAFNYLGVGQIVADPMRLGPADYSRKQQLEAIEDSFKDPHGFRGMETQQVTESLLAATLSRNLELPRFETDGRFARAIRLARDYGTERQKLEAQYEQIWTGFWWFDDFEQLKGSYDKFAELVLTNQHARNLEFLCNLTQLLFNAVFHGHMTVAEAKLPKRVAQLRQALERLANNAERPNNSLEARTFLLMLRANEAMVRGRREDLTAIWEEFADLLKTARGLGEFDADRMVKLIELLGAPAGDDLVYGALVEDVAEFVTERKGEAEGAIILLNRAAKLDFDRRFEMIRLLGKAARKLSKKEYAEQLIETVQLLSVAYRSAGLQWAARASCLLACASIVIESEPESELRVGIVPTMMVWAWVSFSLGHIPEFLSAIQILNGCSANMPLTDESIARVNRNLADLDLALASQMAILDEQGLVKCAVLPDIFEALGLFHARTALLYVLGYEDVLRIDGSLPPEETAEGVHELMSRLGSEGLRHKGNAPLIVNTEDPQTFETTILGIQISVHAAGSVVSILAAEAILGTLEAFFATALELKVLPHAEAFDIHIVISDCVGKPVFALNTADMSGELTWPASLPVTSFEHSQVVGDALFDLVAHVLATTCFMPDPEETLNKLFEDELVQERLSMIALIGNSHHRFLGNFVSRLSEWDHLNPRRYEILPARPILNLATPLEKIDDEDGIIARDSEKGIRAASHSAITVRSVINPHLWNDAQWTGAIYIGQETETPVPPIMALAFKNGDAAKKIFQNWQDRFGANDDDDEIYLSIIRNLPEENPSHYRVMVTSNLDFDRNQRRNANFVIASRSITMTPDKSENLERFLRDYERAGNFGLMPAAWSADREPELFFPLIIGKKRLIIRDAADVKEGELEFMGLGSEHRSRGDEQPDLRPSG